MDIDDEDGKNGPSVFFRAKLLGKLGIPWENSVLFNTKNILGEWDFESFEVQNAHKNMSMF